MKVSYGGRVRKVNVIPSDMGELRRVVQQKFLNLQLVAPDEDQSMQMSKILDDSELNGDNSEFAKLLDSNISYRDEESKIGGRKGKREKNTIDFSENVCFFEDSEGDFNVVSEDEDLQDASTYVLQHAQKCLKLSIVPKVFYEDLRSEQTISDLNQSMTWQSSKLNQFNMKAKKERKVKKQQNKANPDRIPASMMSKIDEIVKAKVDAQLETQMMERLQESMAMSESAPQLSMISDANSSEDAIYKEQRPKMATLISDDTVHVEVMEGCKIALEFTVQNQSTLAWPFKPCVLNEKDKSVKQMVDEQLAPGEQTTVKYMFTAPLFRESKKVHILLQLVDSRDYSKFCDDTILVICKVLNSQEEPVFDFGMSMEEDEKRHSEMVFAQTLEDASYNQKKQALIDMIDQGLNYDQSSSEMYDEASMDDARSMVESLKGNDDDQQNEEDDIIKQTKALLAGLRVDEDNRDEAAEEAKKNEVREKMAKLGTMIDKADELRQKNNEFDQR